MVDDTGWCRGFSKHKMPSDFEDFDPDVVGFWILSETDCLNMLAHHPMIKLK